MDKIAPYLSALGLPVLTAVAGYVAYLFARQSKRDEAREKQKMELAEIEHKRKVAIETLEQMRKNSLDAVQAVEQLYPNLPGPDKAKLALSIANELNGVVGIKPPATIVTALNESQVLTLPNKPKGEG